MKTVVLFFLLFPVLVSAQISNFNSDIQRNDVKKMISNVMKHSDQKFTVEVDSSGTEMNYVLKAQNPVTFSFTKQPGYNSFLFRRISGQFDDLFAIWRLYFNPEASKDQLKAQGEWKLINATRAYFRHTRPEFWTIEVRN
jgi:hypothetical protein